MVELLQKKQERKLCQSENLIQLQEKHLELDTTVIRLDQNTRQDTGLVENGKNKRRIKKGSYD